MNAQAFKETQPRVGTQARSELVFAALVHVPDRYELCQLTAKGARKLHKPTERMQDTVNKVLMILDESSAVRAASITRQRIPEPTLYPVPEASHYPDATRIAMNQTAFMPEERNFSHV